MPSNGGGNRRLLVVDDDLVSLEVLTAMLGSDGHEVLRSSSRKHALDLLSGSSPRGRQVSAVFVDLLMPGPPSVEFAARVRALSAPRPQLIAMSATAAEPAAWEGFDQFLLKPASIDSLRAALAGAEPDGVGLTEKTNSRSSACRPPDSIDGIVLGKLRRAMPRDSLRELYQACLTDSRARIGGLRQLVECGRMDELRPGAHQIKGAAAMVGATRLAALAESLESGSYDKENSLGYLNEMVSECGRIERMLLAGLLDQ